MINLLITFVIALFTIVLTHSNSAMAIEPTTQLIDVNSTSLEAKLSPIFAKQSDRHPGFSLLVKHNDKTIIKTSKGRASHNVAISENTGFRIGSISKTFTALAIMTLIEQGKLTLNDKVGQYLSGLPTDWQKISIKDLMSHRVGLSKDFFSDKNLHLANNATNTTLLQFIRQEGLAITTLSKNEAVYCNTCYVLLAEIISHASDYNFSDYLNKVIFAPASMKHSYIVNENTNIKASTALNYAKTTHFFNIEQYTTGAMAQISSLNDLDNFIKALKQEKIVSLSTLKLMTQVHADMGDDGLYGFGWMIGWGSEPFYSHGGSQDGYQTELFIYPKYNLEIVILSNGGDETYELQGEMIRVIINHYKTQKMHISSKP